TVIGKRHPHFALLRSDIRRRPAEDPFCILRRDVDATMRALLPKAVVPERAMNGNAVAADHCIPGYRGCGITGLSRAGSHIQGHDLPMRQQVSDWCRQL